MRFIHQVENSNEPGAVVVINLFFSQHRGQVALEKLHTACKKVKLDRAVEILEKDQPFLCGGHVGSPLTDDVNVPPDGSSQESTCNGSVKSISNRLTFSTADVAPNNQAAYLPDVTQPTSANSLTFMMNHNSGRSSGSSSQPKPSYDGNHSTHHHSHAALEMEHSVPMYAFNMFKETNV